MADITEPQSREAVTKSCVRCGLAQPRCCFGRSSLTSDGLKTTCKACRRADARAAYHRDVETSRAKAAAKAAKRYASDPVAAAAKVLAWRHAKRATIPPKPPLTPDEITVKQADLLARKRDARKKTYRKNRDKVLAVAAAYRAAHKAEERASRAAHYQRNKERTFLVTKAYREANPHLYAEAFAKRRASRRRATPSWIDRDAIRSVYAEAARLTRETGERYEVDHIVPLQGKNVCGLHVHWNLQVVDRFYNRSKANRHD